MVVGLYPTRRGNVSAPLAVVIKACFESDESDESDESTEFHLANSVPANAVKRI
jgi:hypothetical protein